MRTYFVALLILLAVGGCTQDRPNVIFVMPDDISHNAFSYYNADGPRTPNLDGLAEESVRFSCLSDMFPHKGGPYDRKI